MPDPADYPVLLIDDDLRMEGAEGSVARAIVAALGARSCSVLEAFTFQEGLNIFLSRPQVGCIVLDWDIPGGEVAGDSLTAADLIATIRERNPWVPILLSTHRMGIFAIPSPLLPLISAYLWKFEETPEFIAGRIRQLLDRYLSTLLPPFFGALVDYTREYRYSWHTPGHMGGVAFQKSPAGSEFYRFFGEGTLRADLSASVPELGSLLEHSGVVGAAEDHAAAVFGADRTLFVTNGTSGANAIVWSALVGPGDRVLVDRNCHKSVVHAMIATGAVPVYLRPQRNAYGIIGPVPETEFARVRILEGIEQSSNPGQGEKFPFRLAILTNSTYDGLCYHTGTVRELLTGLVPAIHYDEAWLGYARFHPLYTDRFGMAGDQDQRSGPLIFSTQSTHKVLAAFSQASMIHVRAGESGSLPASLPHAFSLHSSTSPQYAIIASLDMAARMMEGSAGRMLIGDTLEEAVIFRRKVAALSKEFTTGGNKGWFFLPWQSPAVYPSGSPETDGITWLQNNPAPWLLDEGPGWHGFQDTSEGFLMLDPLKVTLLTPGISPDGRMEPDGIPAVVVARYLREQGIVVEKTGYYSFLVLFTIGITRGKSGTLIAELVRFRERYLSNTPLREVFPDLVRDYPRQYSAMGLTDLCRAIHQSFREADLPILGHEVVSELPDMAMTPSEAFNRLVRGVVEEVPVGSLAGRVPAVLIVPYPPGIPLIMPGERFGGPGSPLVRYLTSVCDFRDQFPGFEHEVQGLIVRERDGKPCYSIYCVDETA